MKDTPLETELIERYLDNELTPTNRPGSSNDYRLSPVWRRKLPCTVSFASGCNPPAGAEC